jgi:dTDP-4-amino-4,6-dideoxygalactose transaminase
VIVPVHLFGQNADMESIMKIATENKLFVIEDACQSIGSVYTFSDGKTVHSGCMGDIGCTSFFPSKNLGCFGDGGAIFTNDDVLAAKMRSVANHGMVVRYYHDHVGVNSRLDSIQAAVLDVKLKYLDNYIANRQAVASYYDQAFSQNEHLEIPTRNQSSTHVFHQYTLKLKGVDRVALQKHLESKGIPSMVYYPVPIHLQKAYKDERYGAGDFPVTEQLSACVLSLPIHTEMDEEQLSYITQSVLEAL